MIQLGQTVGPVAGDFNGDGREDRIVFEAPAYDSFHMLVSSGTGSYYAATSYVVPGGGSTSGYAVGDFNRDGKLDLAITTTTSSAHHFYVYLGNGNGTFQAPIAQGVPFSPSGIVAADVNHDGKMDLVLLNAPGGNSASTVVSYLGNGSGGFTAGPSSSLDFNYALNGTGDFDGDGKVDLFTANCGPGGCNFTVYYGDGTGRFGSPTSASANQSNPTVADVDGDGKSDIITSTMGYINSKDQPYLSVFYGAANRTLTFGQIPTTQCTYGMPVVADFNGDHIPDIVFPEHDCSGTSGSSAQMAFLAGKGNRTFGSEQTLFNATYQQQPGGNGNTVLRANNSDSKPDFLFSEIANTSTGWTSFLMVNTSSGKFAGCNAPNSATGFRICSPASGSTVSSPVKFSIGASGQVPMRKVEVWADGVKKFEELYAFSHYAYLDTSIALTKGTHAITIISAGWDNSLQKKSYSVTVQ
jgi:hypothetical protein